MAKRVPPLTATGVAKLKPDPTKTIEAVDGAVPGLRLRVTPAGTRTWSLNMRAKGVMRRFSVGSGLSLQEARRKAEALRQEISSGADPTAEKRAARKQAVNAKLGIGTFRSVIEAYFHTGAGAGLATKDEQLQRVMSVFSAHLNEPAMDVTSAQLQLTIDAHKAKVSGARATGYLVPVIKWALKRGLMKGAFDLDKPVSKSPKQRVLLDDELKVLLPSLTDSYGRCCRFILLTGARRDEARNATWGQFNLEAGNWTIPAEQRKDTRAQERRATKARSDFVVPLSRQAIELLRDVHASELERRRLAGDESAIQGSDLVFVGQRGGKLGNWDRWLKQHAKKTGIGGWSAHALRRTAATLAGEVGAPPHVVSALLGHTNIGGQLVAGYNKSRYMTEHADVLQTLADHLDRFSTNSPKLPRQDSQPSDPKVVQLRAGT